LERAVHAARGRRLKADPRQRALLDSSLRELAAAAPPPGPAVPIPAGAEDAPAVQTPAGPPAVAENEEAEPEAGLGADEHRVAAELDPAEPKPLPAETPRVVMRKPRWL